VAVLAVAVALVAVSAEVDSLVEDLVEAGKIALTEKIPQEYFRNQKSNSELGAFYRLKSNLLFIKYRLFGSRYATNFKIKKASDYYRLKLF
jgi:homoserine trans-succinylase